MNKLTNVENYKKFRFKCYFEYKIFESFINQQRQ